MQVTNILLTAVNAVFPIILLIALGYLLRRKGMLGDGFLENGNKVVFTVSLPVMLFVNVYSIESIADIRWDIVIYSSIAVCVVFALGVVTAVLTTSVSERRGVILQATFRSNYAIVGMTLAGYLGGQEAVAVSAVLSSVAVPLMNMLAVVALTIFIKGEGVSKISPRRILVDIVKNPLIRGVALGLLCLVIRMVQVKLFGRVVFALNRQLKFVYEALNSLKALTTPLALLVLGGQFTFSAAKSLRKEIIVSVFWRLVLAPLIGIGGAYLADRLGWIHCGAAEYPALIALFASPIAVSSAIMAKEMKNDEQLGSQLVVWTCLCSAVTLFVIVCLLMTFGLIPA